MTTDHLVSNVRSEYVDDKEFLAKLMVRHWVLYLSTVTIYTGIVRKCNCAYDITVTVYVCTSTII